MQSEGLESLAFRHALVPRGRGLWSPLPLAEAPALNVDLSSRGTTAGGRDAEGAACWRRAAVGRPEGEEDNWSGVHDALFGADAMALSVVGMEDRRWQVSPCVICLSLSTSPPPSAPLLSRSAHLRSCSTPILPLCTHSPDTDTPTHPHTHTHTHTHTRKRQRSTIRQRTRP